MNRFCSCSITLAVVLSVTGIRSSAQTLTWTQECALGPQSGYYAQMVYDSAHGQIVFFGGVPDPSNPVYPNDTWTWDGTVWTKQSPATKPPGRAGFGMAYDSARGRVVIFGGSSANGFLNDTWEWDGTNWTQKANGPGFLLHVGMTYDAARQQTVLYGGSVGSPFPLANTWVWDGTSWTQKFPATNPGPRSNFRMAYDAARQQIVMFGGWNGSMEVNETWVWDGANWTPRFPANPPSPRQDFGIAYDSNRQRVVLFSGILPPSIPADNNTYEWDGTNWTQDSPAQNPVGPGRGGVSMAYDSAHSQMVLFGGANTTQIFTDTWVFGAPVATTCLMFPLKGTSGFVDSALTPYTAPIVSVFDHSMFDNTGTFHIYGCDGTVQAFSTEFGFGVPTRSVGCLTGYLNSDATEFGVTGHYTGVFSGNPPSPNPQILNYDGHPGFDYLASCTLDKNGNCAVGTGTNVYAVASGTISYPNSVVGLCPSKNGASCANYHVLELIPDNIPTLRVYYLHLSTYSDTKPVVATDPSPAPSCPSTVTLPLSHGAPTHVDSGCLIAQSGNTAPSPVGPHLHFEVQRVLPLGNFPSSLQCSVNKITMACVPVDPYGWYGQFCDQDPYLTGVANIPLWDFQPYLSTTALCFGKVPVGTIAVRQVILTNTGKTALNIGSRTVGGANGTDFAETDTCGNSVSPGNTCVLTITFTPRNIATETSKLTISGNDEGNPPTVTLVVSLKGDGN